MDLVSPGGINTNKVRKIIKKINGNVTCFLSSICYPFKMRAWVVDLSLIFTRNILLSFKGSYTAKY